MAADQISHNTSKGGTMSRPILTLGVRAHRGLGDLLRRTWHERADESGIDEAVTKMIWLAVGIGIAVAATAFFTGVFESARSMVPDPVGQRP